MLIMKPQVDGVHWDSNEGVIVWVSSYLHPNAHTPPEHRAQAVDGDIPINITVLVSGKTAATVEVKSKPFLRYVPGAMDTIHQWVAEHDLVSVWEQEVAVYNRVLDRVCSPTWHQAPRSGPFIRVGRTYEGFRAAYYGGGS